MRTSRGSPPTRRWKSSPPRSTPTGTTAGREKGGRKGRGGEGKGGGGGGGGGGEKGGKDGWWVFRRRTGRGHRGEERGEEGRKGGRRGRKRGRGRREGGRGRGGRRGREGREGGGGGGGRGGGRGGAGNDGRERKEKGRGGGEGEGGREEEKERKRRGGEREGGGRGGRERGEGRESSGRAGVQNHERPTRPATSAREHHDQRVPVALAPGRLELLAVGKRGSPLVPRYPAGRHRLLHRQAPRGGTGPRRNGSDDECCGRRNSTNSTGRSLSAVRSRLRRLWFVPRARARGRSQPARQAGYNETPARRAPLIERLTRGTLLGCGRPRRRHRRHIASSSATSACASGEVEG